MAVETVKSTVIANRDASPRVASNSRISKAFLQSTIGVTAASAASSIGSKYVMVQVPSNARLSQLLLSCDDLGTTGTADIGVYETTANGGAVVDADFFASAQALTTALSNVDVLGEAAGANASLDVAEREQPLWQVLGLTEDPRKDYDIVLTLTQATEDAGDIALEALYVV